MNKKSHEVLERVVGMFMEWEKDLKEMPPDATTVMNELNNFIVHHGNVPPSKNIRECIAQLKTISLQELGFNFEESQMNLLKVITEEGHVNPKLKDWHENITEQKKTIETSQ